jgi:hypothetical protein
MQGDNPVQVAFGNLTIQPTPSGTATMHIDCGREHTRAALETVILPVAWVPQAVFCASGGLGVLCAFMQLQDAPGMM